MRAVAAGGADVVGAEGAGARRPGLSVRLRLTLSYAGFLMVAGVLLLAAVWVYLLEYVPDDWNQRKRRTRTPTVSSSRTPSPRRPPPSWGSFSCSVWWAGGSWRGGCSPR
ncbi:hypothetical protein SCALM49S_02392 [Streptomyces californicus]